METTWPFTSLALVKARARANPALNLVGRCTPESVAGHPYKVHLSCWDDSKFVSCTADTYADMCSRIEALYRSGAPTKEKEELEKKCGIKYEANGAMFDCEVRKLLRFPAQPAVVQRRGATHLQ